MIDYTAVKECWYCATNDIDVYHQGHLNLGENILTGQPELKLFDTENEMIAFVPEKFRQMY